MSAATAFVEASPLFRSLDPESRRDLLELAQLCDAAEGEVVSAEGEETFLLVVEGTCSAQAGEWESPTSAAGGLGEGRVLGAGRPLSFVAKGKGQ